MARVIRFIDDVTGKEIAEDDGGTVQFSLNGEFYELDISNETLARLEKALKPYIEVATAIEPTPLKPTRGRARRASSARDQNSTGGSREFLARVRQWARENGYEVSDRGRIPGHVMEAFDQNVGR